MRNENSWARGATPLIGVLAASVLVAPRARSQSPAPNRLRTGKLVYVAPMPDDLDQWINQRLTAWNRYKVTANAEGVDIEFQAVFPDKRQRLSLSRRGVPQPAKERNAPPTTSVQVLDWVTGATLWQADIVDKKPKQNEEEPAPGPHVTIPARGLSTELLAARITRAFREYVESLNK